MRRFLTILATAAVLAACGSEVQTEAPAPKAARPIPGHACAPVTYDGPGKPQFLIAVSMPLQGLFKGHGIQAVQAIRLLMEQREWRAGDHRVGFQVCDETTATSDYASAEKCARTARAIAKAESAVAVVGPLFSSCALEMLPRLGAAGAEPIPVISPGATYLGLTRKGPGVAEGHPDRLFPGARNFLRLAPPDDVQGAAAASYVHEHGARRAYVLAHADDYGRGLAEAFSTAGRRLGLELVGSGTWDPEARAYTRLARRIARARPDAVMLGGYAFENAARLVRDLRAALPDAQIIGGDAMDPKEIVEGAGPAAEGFLMTIFVVPARVLPQRGREFADAFRRRHAQYPCCVSLHATTAAEMVLKALADGRTTRPEIRDALFGMKVDDSLIGDFQIDRHGDTTLNRIGVYRIEDGRNRFAGTVTPPAALLERP